MKKRLLRWLLPLLILACAGAVLALRGIPGGAPWTVMVYMIGADLEDGSGLATRDIEEMQSALRADTTLLIMTGGAESGAFFSVSECRLYRVERDGSALLSAAPGSMTNPEPLRTLLAAGGEQPRGRRALILWDHGYGALEGFGAAERPLRLTLDSLARALQDTGAAERPLELIGFDACLMAGCEAGAALQPYARYLVASQETEPPQGWDYGFLRGLSAHTDGAAAGRGIINAYCKSYAELYARFPQLRQPYTLSCVALGELPALTEAAGALFTSLEKSAAAGGYSDVMRLRRDAWPLGRCVTTAEYDLVDLGSLARACQAAYPEAAGVLRALDRCVLARDGSEAGIAGLSVYFPCLARAQDRAVWRERLESLPLGAGWISLMAACDDALDGAPALGPLRQAGERSAYLTGEQLAAFARAKYYILAGNDREGYYCVYASGACELTGDTLTAQWDGQALAALAGERQIPLAAFLRQEDSRTAYYYTPLILLENGERPRNLTLRLACDTAARQWSLLSAMEQTDGLMTGRQELPLDALARQENAELWAFRPIYRPRSDQERDTLPWTAWESTGYFDYDTLPLGDVTAVEEVPLPRADGQQYWLQLVVCDTYGREYAAPLFPL